MINTRPLPTLNLKKQQSKRVVEGLALIDIIATSYGGIIRPKLAEPWEAETLLVKSNWEEGIDKYYIVQLPKQAQWRELGRTMMAKEHMANSQAFNDQVTGYQAYLKLCKPYD